MEVYINSRGKNRHQDYHWHKISPEGEKRVLEQSVIKRFSPLMNMINSEIFSLALAYSEKQLLLFITALEPENGRFQGNRIIRNSLALVGDLSDEISFRLIAASALQGELAQKLENAIEFDSETGFKINLNYSNFLNQLIPKIRAYNVPPELHNSIEFLSKENRIKLSEELKNCSLPQKDGLLVVLTQNISKSILRDRNVWRGLTLDMTEDKLALRQRKISFEPSENIGNLIGQIIKLGIKNIFLIIFVLLVITTLVFFQEKLNITNLPKIIENISQPEIVQRNQNNNIEVNINETKSRLGPFNVEVNKPIIIIGYILTDKKKILI